MTLSEVLEAHIPIDWRLSNLINLEPGWQVNLCDGEFVVVATGDSIEEALASASTKTLDQDQYVGRLASFARHHSSEPPQYEGSLLERLGLLRKMTIRRR